MKKNTHAERFAEIYSAEIDSVFKFCLLRTSDRETAADFTQDVFLRFWKALSEGQIIKNHRGFLFTIARNLIIDGYRKKKTMSLDALLEEGNDDKSLVASTANNTAETEAEANHALRKLDMLDEPYRRVVYLRYVEGLKPQEISRILEESTNVISVRISRGLKHLKSTMGYSNHSLRTPR